jgi:hypothetical protein
MAPWVIANHEVLRKPPGALSSEGFCMAGGFRTKRTLGLGYGRVQERHRLRQDPRISNHAISGRDGHLRAASSLIR